jgi:outer membrane protein OmpA-like peptidoglycan-associated protein
VKGPSLAFRAAAALLAASSLGVAAQGAAALGRPAPASTAPGDALRLVEKSDFSRYVDGKYIGHAYREARGFLAPEGDAYAGEFLVLEETLRDMRSAARRVDRNFPVRLDLRGSSFAPREDSGFPSLRGLPSFPKEGVEAGSAWTAEGTRALDFDDSGAFVLLPFLAQYSCKGFVDYRGSKALSLAAKFATRWKADGGKPSAPLPAEGEGRARVRPVSEIVAGASGTHELDIIVDAESLAPLFIRDRFDESFALVAGGSERRSGFSLFFFEGAAPVDRGADGEAIASTIAKAATRGDASAADEAAPVSAGPKPLLAGEGPGLEDMDPAAMDKTGLELDTSPEGLVLRVKDLRFVADSDSILPDEAWRLDAIAAALKALPGRTFLVAGHSAGVGKALGELELSEKRAKKVSDELAARGIEATRLLYRGFGSSKPLEPNDTEAGRAKNRRVEITILD